MLRHTSHLHGGTYSVIMKFTLLHHQSRNSGSGTNFKTQDLVGPQQVPAAAGKGTLCKRPLWRRMDALERVLTSEANKHSGINTGRRDIFLER